MRKSLFLLPVCCALVACGKDANPIDEKAAAKAIGDSVASGINEASKSLYDGFGVSLDVDIPEISYKQVVAVDESNTITYDVSVKNFGFDLDFGVIPSANANDFVAALELKDFKGEINVVMPGMDTFNITISDIDAAAYLVNGVIYFDLSNQELINVVESVVDYALPIIASEILEDTSIAAPLRASQEPDMDQIEAMVDAIIDTFLVKGKIEGLDVSELSNLYNVLPKANDNIDKEITDAISEEVQKIILKTLDPEDALYAYAKYFTFEALSSKKYKVTFECGPEILGISVALGSNAFKNFLCKAELASDDKGRPCLLSEEVKFSFETGDQAYSVTIKCDEKITLSVNYDLSSVAVPNATELAQYALIDLSQFITEE